MKKAMTQLIAIILVAVIAAGCGFGGACLALRVKNSDTKLGQLLRDVIAEDKAQNLANADKNNGSSSNTDVTNRPCSITVNVDGDITIAEAVAEKVLPSVVGIETVWEEKTGGGMSGWPFGFGFGDGGGSVYENKGVGTGVVVDEAGYILTNSHVINDGDYKRINVSLYDGQNVEGTVVWNEQILDLAVVKITAENLVAAELGDSDTVKIGSYAAAIGNPLGLDFQRSMSQGIISGLNRTITVSGSGSSSATTMEGLMQTDATINSGNSGGPLLNSKGQVIGINSAKAGSGEGMGFAIPINVAKPIVEQIKETGSFTRPYIGISGMGLESQSSYSDAQLIEMFGVSDGIYVSTVAKGGGADAAGIKSGDVIIAINGTAVNTMNKLNSILVTFAPGDSVELTVMRENQEMKFNVVLTDGNITF